MSSINDFIGEKKTEDVSAVKDLRLIATLLASGQVQFVGTKVAQNVVYCNFTPSEIVDTICRDYFAYNLNGIQPKTVLEKLDTARDIVFRAKDRARVLGVTYEPR